MNYNGAQRAGQQKLSSFVLNSEQNALWRQNLRIIVGITGASGSVYGIRLMEKVVRNANVEVHFLITKSGERTLWLETGHKTPEIRAMAHHSYSVDDIGAPIASGSFETAGMVIAPCSINSMSAIAAGITSNLLLRAADVTLKERRKLVLMVRESPYHLGHLRAMTALTEAGAIIAPPVPAFYLKPNSITDLIDHSVDRVLDLLGLPAEDARRWQGQQ